MSVWCAVDTAVRRIASGNRVYVQVACVTPTPLLEALVGRGKELRAVELTHLHTYGPTPYTDERWAGHFSLRALFVGENVRAAANIGRASYRTRARKPLGLSQGRNGPSLAPCRFGGGQAE